MIGGIAADFGAYQEKKKKKLGEHKDCYRKMFHRRAEREAVVSSSPTL